MTGESSTPRSAFAAPPSCSATPTPRSRPSAIGASVALHVYVPDVDALTAQAVAAGAELLTPPTDMPYGPAAFRPGWLAAGLRPGEARGADGRRGDAAGPVPLVPLDHPYVFAHG